MEAEEEERARLMAEEQTRIAEERRLKAEAEEQARLKEEEEAHIAEELRLKAEAKEQASLKEEEEAHFFGELKLKADTEEQARLEAEEEKRLADELNLKAEAWGFCDTGVERRDRQVTFGIVLAAFGYSGLGVGSLWRWGTLGYWYSHTCTSCISPLSGLPLSMQ